LNAERGRKAGIGSESHSSRRRERAPVARRRRGSFDQHLFALREDAGPNAVELHALEWILEGAAAHRRDAGGKRRYRCPTHCGVEREPARQPLSAGRESLVGECGIEFAGDGEIDRPVWIKRERT
jgi:hypothetical protein